MITCNKCKQKLEISFFSKNSSKPNGHNSTCKKCQQEYAKNHYILKKDYYILKSKVNKKTFYQNNLNKINKYKANQTCMYCTESDPCCLDLHHRESDKKEYTIANKLANFSWANLEKEILKCDVVCSNCHRKIHAGQKLVSLKA
jgi:hypothetical protein